MSRDDSVANEILMYIRTAKKYNNEISLQDPIGYDREGNEVTMEDKLSGEYETIEDQVDLKNQILQFYDIIRRDLTDRERLIIELRYGLNRRVELTQREIAEMLDISRSYVSRIEKKALEKLNKGMK